jgi:glycosyl transferase, family 25
MQMPSVIDLFDKSYIINLPERRDRYKTMRRELEKVGIFLPSDKVEIFPAVKKTERGEFPSVGARGCFLSHLAILRQAKKLGLNNVLIMEDDLSFSNLFIKNQQALTTEIQQLEWDILYLGHIETVKATTTSFQPFSQALRTTHFLAINASVIERLVHFFEKFLSRPAGHPDGGPMHVDGAYSTFRQQNPEVITLIATPTLGFQRPSLSDIYEERAWYDRLPVLSQLMSVARTVKLWYKRKL